MTGRYSFEVATPADDAALRAFLRECYMEGAIHLSFRREPSFFVAERVGARSSQAIVVRDTHTRQVVGLGSRSIRRVYVNGEARDIGYLGGLRSHPSVRGRTLLARGYRFLKELHQDGQAPYYLTTIMEDNENARRILESGRGGLPTYRYIGRLATFVVPLGLRKGGPGSRDVLVTQASPDVLKDTVAFINRHNRARQFAPHYEEEDFQDSGVLPGMTVDNVYVAWQGENIVGVVGVWDQRRFKQTVVMGYEGALRWLRPVVNIVTRVKGFGPLPKPGSPIDFFYVGFVAIDPPNSAVLSSLLDHVSCEAPVEGCSHFLIGLSADDPMQEVLHKYHPRTLFSRIYIVHWEDEDDGACVCAPGQRMCHLEIATL